MEVTVFDPKRKHRERELMELAVRLAEKSIPEDNGRLHPMVGAVIARDGYVLSTGFRGEKTPGMHAEEVALARLTAAQAVGTTVYTTLEPCTARGKMACAQRLITKRASHVSVGMLDPNPDIRGQGEWLLESVGISVGKFESDFVSKIKAMNSEFIDYTLGLGVAISSPSNGATVEVEPISVRGTYRVRPRPGDNVVLFGRAGSIYYPQAAISWSRNPEDRTWECPAVWLTAGDEPRQYGLVVARVSEDLSVWLRSYTRVGEITKQWIGADMRTPPPGFEVLASISVTRSARKTSPPK
jgi:diaminohydroxyphosphoribosylaminopyrimidine deaminase/5-amino-6-(5-phosphoribosylamino)uracil reductase